jgi:fimbrial isopeptide formation D2 family protein
MSSRGTSLAVTARNRKGIVFFWIALFVMSIALQYAQLSRPSPVDAASGLLADTVAGFEIDGDLKGNNASDNPGSIPDEFINNPPMADGQDWLDPNGVADPDGTENSTTFLFEDATDPGDISAYAGGNKESDTRDWDYVNAAGPNAKTDFKHIMAHANIVSGHAFAYMGAERLVNNGTMVVDFELNKKQFKVFPAGGPPKPDRSNGDLLISLEYSNGGGNPIVTIYTMANVQNFPSGQTVDFVAVAAGPTRDAVRSATNFDILPDQGFGYPIPAFDFAEASIDLFALGITQACPGFSSGHMRSRTGGDPASSQLKDTARPFDIDLNNCGTITIVKNAVPNDPQDFDFTTTGGAPLANFSLDNDGDDSNALSKTKTFLLVPPGDYTVTETAVDRWVLTGLTCVDDKVQNSEGNLGTRTASIDVQANENVTCTFTNTKEMNNPTITTSANQTGVVVGGTISDSATLAGGFNPTGTITFRAYGPNDPTCANAPAFTSDPVTVNGNGTYGPVSFTPQGAGTFLWIASYSGDGENNPVAGNCGDPGETDTVIKASPAIATSADEPAVVIGNAVHDTAVLSGGVTPTGTITFSLYSTADCSGTAVFTTSLPVNGNGSYGPVQFVPTEVGTYHWIASYDGDAKNDAATGACGDPGENDTVIPASPTIATVAHLPTTGTVTFNLYGRLDPNCAGTAIFTSTVSIGADGTATSGSFTVTEAGNYHWIASYSGDDNNDAVAGTCGDDGETTSIRAFNPEITTSLSSGELNGPKITVLFGASVTDQATLTGASAAAGGTVTYTVFSDDECTTEFADAGTKNVVNGIVGASDPVTFPTAGTFYWQAAYSGDINNAPATSVCTDEVVTVTTPDINVLKLVRTNDGTFAPTSSAEPGDVLTFQITVSNTGDADANDVPVTDDINPVLAHATYNGDCSNGCDNTAGVLSWTIDVPAGGQVVLTYSVTLADTFPEGATVLPNVVIVTGPGSNCPAASEDPDCDTTTDVSEFVLTIDKVNDAPPEILQLPDGGTAVLPTADEGSTVTYTLTYTVGTLEVTNGVIVDELPDGVTYIAGTASSDTQFTFKDFNTTNAGALTWTAASVSEGGTLTYKVKIDIGASKLAQPLENTATIDSEETEPDSDTSVVFVPVVPLVETAPPTDVLATPEGPSAPGSSLLLILAVLGGIVLVIGFVTPVPAVVRRRNRR